MKTMNFSIIRILLACIIGLILVLRPDTAVEYIIITLGVAFILPGILGFLQYFIGRKDGGEFAPHFPLAGLGSLLLGIWLVVNPLFFADFFVILLGIILMLGGIQQVASLWMAHKYVRVPVGAYVMPLLILIAGIISLFHPTDVRRTLFIYLGIISLVYAFSELINLLIFTYRANKYRHQKQKQIEDAEIIE